MFSSESDSSPSKEQYEKEVGGFELEEARAMQRKSSLLQPEQVRENKAGINAEDNISRFTLKKQDRVRSDSIFVHGSVADANEDFEEAEQMRPSNTDIQDEEAHQHDEAEEAARHANDLDHKPWLKAQVPEYSSSSGDDEHMTMHNNPFTKLLINKLGPQFDPTNLYNKNKKMFHNLAMLDGLAICTDNVGYERTYLDQIKIKNYYQDGNFNDKPSHIDKLFENEDQFLDGPYHHDADKYPTQNKPRCDSLMPQDKLGSKQGIAQ